MYFSKKTNKKRAFILHLFTFYHKLYTEYSGYLVVLLYWIVLHSPSCLWICRSWCVISEWKNLLCTKSKGRDCIFYFPLAGWDPPHPHLGLIAVHRGMICWKQTTSKQRTRVCRAVSMGGGAPRENLCEIIARHDFKQMSIWTWPWACVPC